MHLSRAIFAAVLFTSLPVGLVLARSDEPLPPASALKSLSVQELMDIQVTSVSKHPEQLSEAPAAIQIITGEDVRRSAATTLPEALRLAPNLQVAQVNAHDWAVTARGFNGAPLANNSLANKLLVMIDGRSVYTPLFGGVFWDVQSVLLEDLDRIEVVSGPGGTLWGANAVNGVINVVTKSAKDTQGLYVSGAGGSFLQDLGAARYGGHVGSNLFYRLYGQRFDHNSTDLESGPDARDDWDMTQGGFRADYDPSDADTLTLQGDFYSGCEGDPTSTILDGQNVLGRWKHAFSAASDLAVQLYFDRTWRNLPDPSFNEDLQTYDIEIQHRFPLGARQSILWGAGYRVMRDNVGNSPALSFMPATRNLQLGSAFVQDEVTLVPKRLSVTVGTKIEHNDYSGMEVQPSGRIAWTLTARQTIWGAISRAVRSPSRLDADVTTPAVIGDDDFESEKVLAYELGYRVQPFDRVSLSVAAFYNEYDDVRSINANTIPPPNLRSGNGQKAETWGVEVSGQIQATDWWRLRGGYTYLDEDFHSKNALVVPGSDTFEAVDPHNQFLLQSIVDLPWHFQLDLVGRYVDALPSSPITPRVAAYGTFDARLAWHLEHYEISLVGRNLWDEDHVEFGAPASPREIPRSIYGKITVRL
jgi:iron complex outermembrane receptor protein